MPQSFSKRDIETAEAAVAYAQQVRSYHRRRSPRTSKQRTADIKIALKRLSQAMRPLRSAMGRFPYESQTDIAEANREQIRQAAASIKKERVKLWKMLPDKKVTKK